MRSRPFPHVRFRGVLALGILTNGSSQDNTQITGVSPTLPHRYRIAWTATGVEYLVDGAQVATHPIAIGGNMRPLASDLNLGGGSASADWVRMSPYAAAATFTSRVLDSGQAGPASLTLAADSATPGGTQLALETRSGDTTSSDASWSAWQPVGAGGAIAGPSARYIQHGAALSTANDTLTSGSSASRSATGQPLHSAIRTPGAPPDRLRRARSRRSRAPDMNRARFGGPAALVL